MIYTFSHPHNGDHSEMVARLGGKGAGLWTMVKQLSLPVPPGFTLETAIAPPLDFMKAVRAGLAAMGEMLGRQFGDPVNPLLVSVRSGAPISMPGMMDTILNVGLTASTLEGLIRRTQNPGFVNALYQRFLEQFIRTVLHEQPKNTQIEVMREQIAQKLGFIDDAERLLEAAIEGVFRSWNAPRARIYRAREGIPKHLGTAVTIQAMVFGNLDQNSGSGVAFTRCPSTGVPEPKGDWLPQAQGEDVVSGKHMTLPLSQLEQSMPHIWKELEHIFYVLEGYYRHLCDIEFTVEGGKLWILQTRLGKCSPAAAARIAVDFAENPRFSLSKADVLARLPDEVLFGSLSQTMGLIANNELTRGLGVSPGVVTGKVALDPEAAILMAEAGDVPILVRPETSPEDVHGMVVSKGILTGYGGLMSHAAVIARSWGLPAVCGAEAIEFTQGGFRVGDIYVAQGDLITLDGSTGEVFLGAVDGFTRVDPYVAKLQSWTTELEALRRFR